MEDVQRLIDVVGRLEGPNQVATAIWCTFIGFLAVGYYVFPGAKSKGTLLADGKTRLEYNINGLISFVFLIALFYGGVATGSWKATILYDQYWPLAAVIHIFVALHMVLLYVHGYLIAGVKSKGAFHDFWMGIELNPRLGSFDLKYFAYRPLIMGWAMMILSIAHYQYEHYGTVSTPMLLYVVFTWIYSIDYLWVEHKMITTWDVIAENFGFSLVWGDYFFYPYYYSIQAHFLIEPFELPPLAVAAIVVTFALGYVIFRQANNQKDEFKRVGKKAVIWGAPAKTTKDGRLLVSGWWGILRHANYTGDILLSLAEALPCGFSSIFPWAQFLFFVPFLMHRAHRDSERCSAKYGATYAEYKKSARWAIFPYVY